jgi:hypothetical protein
MGKIGILAALLLLSASSVMAQGVKTADTETLPYQLGVGVTYLNFHEGPGTVPNGVGFTASLVDYKDWLGAEVQVSDVFGSTSGKASLPLFAGGGIRFRWLPPRNYQFQPWGHFVIGFSHLYPNTSLGNNQAVAFKAGGGIDFNPHRSRIGFRVSADLFRSGFFKTYQLSPEFSAGIVYHFGHQ